MPTGGGKSVCFQVPAMAMPGLCLVVTPLIALMKDQVENLRRKNIPALFIHSGLNFKEVKNAFNSARHGGYKFLYVSPERLQTDIFREYLPALPLNMMAVDEAHCISQWGYDFRPSYLQIATVREEKPGVPVLALTASATVVVQKDICDKLHFRSPALFQQSYERANLSYSVFNVPVKVNKLLDIIRNVQGCGIVYCRSRKRTVETASLLQLHGISAGFYHAGLSHEERNSRQEDWMKNKIRIIVCTNAFGMGIDKADVRMVVHLDPPDCIENYYQEAGRAGRDGKKSYAVLLYRDDDITELENLPESRFPSLAAIRIVYQALVNYFQLPAGSGEWQYFEFDLDDFSKRFGLSPLLVTYAIKALEQESILSYTEQVFNPSTVMFTCSRERLQEIEAANPKLESYIRFLLRSYGGILDVPVPVSENLIARVLKKEPEEVKRILYGLRDMAVIDYQPQKDKPQIQFLSARVPAEALTINMQEYLQRKQVLTDQVKAMTGYITDHACRAMTIGKYFNDRQIKPCGVCDNCLKQKTTDLSGEEFTALYNSILLALSNQSLNIKELSAHTGTVDMNKLWKVVDLLTSEGFIEMETAAGGIRLRAKKKGQG